MYVALNASITGHESRKLFAIGLTVEQIYIPVQLQLARTSMWHFPRYLTQAHHIETTPLQKWTIGIAVYFSLPHFMGPNRITATVKKYTALKGTSLSAQSRQPHGLGPESSI
jgi:hypothetical protein